MIYTGKSLDELPVNLGHYLKNFHSLFLRIFRNLTNSCIVESLRKIGCNLKIVFGSIRRFVLKKKLKKLGKKNLIFL